MNAARRTVASSGSLLLTVCALAAALDGFDVQVVAFVVPRMAHAIGRPVSDFCALAAPVVPLV